MSNPKKPEQIHTRIWLEEPESDNPFATKAAYCHGYDVFGELVGQSRWIEMLYLLFRGEAPSARQTELLEAVAVALANPGPRAPSVHAAMCAGVGGSTAASSLIAALAVGAGGREIYLAMKAWNECGTNITAWQDRLATPTTASDSSWPSREHPPGFDLHGVNTSTSVKQTLTYLAAVSDFSYLSWLETNLSGIESAAGSPLAMSGVAAAAFSDLGFSPEQGEMLHLLLSLPGAAAHALEQWEYGHKKFPFFSVELENNSIKEAP